MKTIKLILTPYLWKTLVYLSIKHNCTIPETIRMCIIIIGGMEDCLPEEGDVK